MSMLIRESRSHLIMDASYNLRRELPAAGNLLVKRGDTVHTTQVIGRCKMPGSKERFRLDSVLSVSARSVERYLQVELGQLVKAGEVIAQRNPLMGSRVFCSPINGRLASVDGESGDIVIERNAIDYSLEAGFEGIVDSTTDDRVIDLRIGADQLIGVMGIGLPAMGTIEVVTEQDEALEAKHIDGGCCDHVVISAGSIDYAVVKRSMALGVRGIVAASMPARDFLEYVNRECRGNLQGPGTRGISLILTEGFGRHAMQPAYWNWLERLRGQLVLLDSPAPGVPAVIFPNGKLPSEERSSLTYADTLVAAKKGMPVRLVGGVFFGQIGTLMKVDITADEMVPGAGGERLDVRLANKQTLTVPRWNVEALAN